MLYKASRVTAR